MTTSTRAQGPGSEQPDRWDDVADPVVIATRKAILDATGSRPAARSLTPEQCRTIADRVLAANDDWFFEVGR